MKQYQLNKAYEALSKISNMPLPVRDAYKIYMLLQHLRYNYEFQVTEERKLIDKYNGCIMPDGEIVFHDADDSVVRSFRADLNELNNNDVELDMQPITISFDSFGNNTITPNDVAVLNGFVSFE